MKQDNARHSRGYCGYFTTSKGRVIYLRSLKEYIVASWLTTLESEKLTLLGESYVEPHYRPDFVIYINNKIRFVIEVKDNAKEAQKYFDKYKKVFNDKGIHYIIIYKRLHFSKILTELQLDTQAWKDNAVYDYTGQNNPHFGHILTEESKQKIGNATTERCQSEKYRNKLSEAIKASWTSERKILVGENIKHYATIRRAIRDENDPFIEIACIYCGTNKTKRKSQCKEIEFCGAGCAVSYYASIGKSRKFTAEESVKRFKITIQKAGKRILNEFGDITEELIATARNMGVINKNCQLSTKSILKYYNDFNHFKLEIING